MGRATESDSRVGIRAVLRDLLLDLSPERMGDRYRVPGCGLSQTLDEDLGTARDAQFLQSRCAALFLETREPDRSHTGQLQWGPANEPERVSRRGTCQGLLGGKLLQVL